MRVIRVRYALVALFLVFALLPIRGFALLSFDDGAFPELIQSGRALGMANAFIARVDDESAPFYNPAGLGTVRRWRFQLNNFLLEGNRTLFRETTRDTDDTYDRIKGSFDLDTLRKIHLDNPGHFTFTHFSMAPNFTTRFLSFGYLYSRKVRSFYEGNGNPNFEYADRSDHGPYVGVNFSLYGGIIKGGAAFILLNRRELRGDADVNQKFHAPPVQKAKGSMLLTNVGARVTLPVKTLPSFAITIHNLNEKGFDRDDKYPFSPISIKKNVVLGFSITPIIGRGKKLHLEVNYKDLNGKYTELKDSRRWVFGAELNLFRMLFFRTGLYDKFISWGAGVKIDQFNLDFTSYATESFSDREDRRFLLSTSVGF